MACWPQYRAASNWRPNHEVNWSGPSYSHLTSTGKDLEYSPLELQYCPGSQHDRTLPGILPGTLWERD
ncbi:unnamed protein product [Periconia digitata]|uniref:Uncharacterized protein n=1 Tax=Periconia digitata TaxID=1303443 RepID=A0A9W4XPI8_9PLEO|nr:unnamed protein product [Periconia digitata]